MRHAVSITVLVLALLGGAYFLSDYDNTTQAEKQQQESENGVLRSEQSKIQIQLSTGFEVKTYYDTYIKNHSDNFALNRDTATQWLTVLHSQNHLANLGVTISPITDVAGSNFETGIMTKSEVNLTFNALTDSSVYGFIEALERQLPGLVIMHDLKLTHTAELSQAILIDLSQHKITPMVEGELAFTWLGLRPKPQEKSASGATDIKGSDNGK